MKRAGLFLYVIVDNKLIPIEAYCRRQRQFWSMGFSSYPNVFRRSIDRREAAEGCCGGRVEQKRFSLNSESLRHDHVQEQ